MEPNLLSILPNLGIGVVAVVSLVYVTREFIFHLREERTAHGIELKEREQAMRQVEKEVRTNIMEQLGRNTHVMERAINVLDRK